MKGAALRAVGSSWGTVLPQLQEDQGRGYTQALSLGVTHLWGTCSPSSCEILLALHPSQAEETQALAAGCRLISECRWGRAKS